MTDKLPSLETMKDENGLYPVDILSILVGADQVELARLTRVGKMVIEHSRYEQAWEWLSDVLTESDTGREATTGLFYGVSGAGKSTILRRFAKKFGGPSSTKDGIIRPVIRVSTPANPNLVNLLQAILMALEAEGLVNNDAGDMRLSVLRQLTGQQARMIIFDECTHIVEDRSEKFAVKTMRGLKELLSEKHCQVVFAGTEDLVKIHKLYGQMRRLSLARQPGGGLEAWQHYVPP
jgi:ABC-type phosphate/phosphonate transport system ATPase subunit